MNDGNKSGSRGSEENKKE